jgi:hypothetical protein
MAIWAPVNSVIQVNIKMNLITRKGEVTDYLRVAGNPIDSSDLATFTTAAQTNRYLPGGGLTTLNSKLMDLVAIGASVTAVTAQPINIDPLPVPVLLWGGNIGGRRAGDPLPPQVSMMFRYRTEGPARSGQGRRFFPFFSEADTNSGVWSNDPQFQAGLSALGTEVVKGFTFVNAAGQTVTLQPVVVSRRRQANWLILQALATEAPRTQRRRAGRLPSIVP